MIRPAVVGDAEAIAAIYNHYVAHTPITFETEAVSAMEMASRIEEILSVSLPWLVIETDGLVSGYAYASKWKGRCAYRYSVETTVYLDASRSGQGLGSRLYEALIGELQRLGLHVAIGGIALPNAASVALHEKFGFEPVARFREVGFKFGQWLDVGYWQRLL